MTLGERRQIYLPCHMYIFHEGWKLWELQEFERGFLGKLSGKVVLRKKKKRDQQQCVSFCAFHSGHKINLDLNF